MMDLLWLSLSPLYLFCLYLVQLSAERLFLLFPKSRQSTSRKRRGVKSHNPAVGLKHIIFATEPSAHTASYPMGVRSSSPRLKWPECEADLSCLSSVKFENVCSFTSSPSYVFMTYLSTETTLSLPYAQGKPTSFQFLYVDSPAI
jgi:hypothetical protein